MVNYSPLVKLRKIISTAWFLVDVPQPIATPRPFIILSTVSRKPHNGRFEGMSSRVLTTRPKGGSLASDPRRHVTITFAVIVDQLVFICFGGELPLTSEATAPASNTATLYRSFPAFP